MVCGVSYVATSATRIIVRKGYCHRKLDIRVVTSTMVIPKLRLRAFFCAWLLERRSRKERAFIIKNASCYLKGESTRRMNYLVATLRIDNLSRSQGSEAAEGFDIKVRDFHTRPLDIRVYLYISCNVITKKCINAYASREPLSYRKAVLTLKVNGN